MKPLIDYLEPGETPDFDHFWEIYPKKANKIRAKRLWDSLSADKKEKACVDVPARLESHTQWQERQFIPAPDVYLYNEKWDDDIVVAKTLEEKQAETDNGSNLDRFWTIMKQTYGDERIKRQYGETMPFMWKKMLDGLTKREIGKIISYLMNDSEPGLPNLSKIVRIRRIGKEEHFKSLPKPMNTELALESLEKAKEILNAPK